MVQDLKTFLFEDSLLSMDWQIDDIENLALPVDTGSRFEDICNKLNLDSVLVWTYLVRYALHQIKGECISLSQDEKNELESIATNRVGQYNISDILEGTYYTDPQDYFKTFDQSILGMFPLKNELSPIELSETIFGKVPYSYDNSDYEIGNGFTNLWHAHSRKMGSFYKLYKECGVIRPKKPLNTAGHNLNTKNNNEVEKVRRFLNSHNYHYEKFQEMLNALPNSYDISEDVLLLEKDSDLFFLRKVYASLMKENWFEKLSEKNQEKYLQSLSAFVLIDDVNLKLYAVDRFIEEGATWSFIESYEGISALFQLIFFYGPALKELLLEKLTQVSKNKFEGRTWGRKLKIKLNNYLFLKKFHYYTNEWNEEKCLLNVDSVDVEKLDTVNLNTFLRLYRKIEKVRNLRDDFIEACGSYIAEHKSLLQENGTHNNWNEFVESKANVISLLFQEKVLNLTSEIKSYHLLDPDLFNFEEQEIYEENLDLDNKID